MKQRLNAALLLAVALVTFALLYLIVNSGIPGMLKFIVSLVLLVASGMFLHKFAGIEGEWGLLILKDSSALGLVNRVARWHPEFWKGLADFGLIMGFGVWGFFLMGRKGRDLKRDIVLFLASMLVLILTAMLVVPNIYPVASSVITSVDLNSASGTIKEATAGSTGIFAIVAFIVLVLGGLALTATLSIVLYGLMVSSALVQALLGSGAALARTAPGATLIIPGINLPLIEGILALAIILIVHEGAHGILARIAGVRLKSAGIALIGVIPAGAFIDPDEKGLARKQDIEQNRVLVAGSTANIITCLVFFLLLVSFVAISGAGRASALRIEQSGTLKNGTLVLDERVIPAGTVITHINGIEIEKMTNTTFAANSTVAFTSIEGKQFLLKANESGKIGKLLAPYSIIFSDGSALVVNSTGASDYAIEFWRFIYKPGFGWLGFIYNVLGLAFCLNFLVGAVNLLPLPMFDGYRIVSIGIKDKRLVHFIMAVVATGFLLNFLPWLFK